MKIVFAVLAIAAALIVLTVVFGGLAGFIVACRRRKSTFEPERMRENNPVRLCYDQCKRDSDELMKKTSGEISVTADDGTILRARLFLQGKGDRFIILVHGYHSDWVRDFGSIARFWYESGYSLFIADCRAHGSSGGKYICYGVKERYDICRFAEYLSHEYPGCRILLHGISMGGASVMMAADTPLPEEVVGIIDDCGYTTPYEIIYRVSGLPRIMTLSASLWARILAGFSFRGASALDAAKKSGLPKLIIHGEKDTYVPYEMGERVFCAASGDKTFLSVPDAPHAISFYVQPDTVKRALTDFANKTLGQA